MSQIILKNRTLRAVIDSHGANCISFQSSALGLCVLRETKEGQEKDNPFLYGMPLLFPANRISGGAFVFEGRRYDFGINEQKTGCQLHGCLHEQVFSILEKEESRVLLGLDLPENSLYPSFPHAFSIRIEYELIENALVQTVTIENRSKHAMPCLLGFHTTFCARTKSGEPYLIKADVSEYYERDERYLPTGRIIAHDDLTQALQNGSFCACGPNLSRHYQAQGQGKISLTDPMSGLRIFYELDEKYIYRLFYNGDADEFICLEPQTCRVDAINRPFPEKNELGFDMIDAEQTKTYKSKIVIDRQ